MSSTSPSRRPTSGHAGRGTVLPLDVYPIPMPLTPPGARRAVLVGVVLLLSLSRAAVAGAQVSTGDRASNLAINGAIGSVLAATQAVLAGRSPWKALAPGFGGGVIMGAGKQLAGSRFFGAGLLGRQVASAGVGVVELAARDTMVFRSAFGPLTLEVRPKARDRVRSQINVVDAGTLVIYALQRDARLDVAGTISTGTPVFRLPVERMEFQNGTAEGFQHTGVILIAENLAVDSHHRQLILAHETIHVLQEDAVSYLVGLPVERALIRRLPLGERAPRLLDVGALAPLGVIWLSTRMRYESRPWEREAYALTEGGWPR